MSITTPDALPPTSITTSLPPKRGWPLVAWVVIAAAVVYSAGYEAIRSRLDPRFAARWKEYNERNYLSDLQITGREIIGTVRFFDQTAKSAEPQIEEGLTHGPYEQRLRYVILSGEIDGPGTALENLSAMRRNDWPQHPPTEQERQLTELVEKLYRQQQRRLLAGSAGGGPAAMALVRAEAEHAEDGAGDTLTDADRAELRDKLDWFGELALAPEGGGNPTARVLVLTSAKRVIVVLFAVVVAFLLLASLGAAALLTAVFLLAMRVLHFRFQAGSRDGGLYAETFALWMVVYLVLERASAYVPLGSFRMLAAGLVGLLTLATLAWPVLRGVRWQRVRQDVGWWTPGPAGIEMLWGAGGYLASMPLTVLGVMASAGLLALYNRVVGTDPFGIPPQATHPVKELLAHGSWWEILQILFVASVCAPIIEETMFRGVLYRHLREIGTRWPRAVRVLFSVVSSSFVFAVIHPQGFLGVPVLMALAIGFALTRELRGSLLGCMTAHGINNALVTFVAVSMS